MEEIKDLGVKIAENSDEAFWLETKNKCEEALKAEHRNIKINQAIINLCLEHLR